MLEAHIQEQHSVTHDAAIVAPLLLVAHEYDGLKLVDEARGSFQSVTPKKAGYALVTPLTVRLARLLGNGLPRNVYRDRFPYGSTLYVIHKLLFWVWVSCVSELKMKG
uniref:SFRICE_017433 n=1 Tax=Spodoptera frugiperda TaxID=7108 RepID=A0A2H1W7N0_SPOFR